MALIICPECGKKHSDKAIACPECGLPNSRISSEPKLSKSEQKKKSINFFKVEQKDKPEDKNKASKKEVTNFLKAEKKDRSKNKNYWKNLNKKQKIIAASFLFLFGALILQSIFNLFESKSPKYIRTPVYVPMPSQPRIDPALQRSIDRRNKILNPSGVRCSQGLGLYGEPSINCQQY